MSTVFHFSFGNSTDDGIGCAANIVAADRKAALKRLRELLPYELEINISGHDPHPEEYVNVYFNDVGIHVEDIDDEYEVAP